MKYLAWIICIGMVTFTAAAHADTIVTYSVAGTTEGTVYGPNGQGTADQFGFGSFQGALVVDVTTQYASTLGGVAASLPQGNIMFANGVVFFLAGYAQYLFTPTTFAPLEFQNNFQSDVMTLTVSDDTCLFFGGQCGPSSLGGYFNYPFNADYLHQQFYTFTGDLTSMDLTAISVVPEPPSIVILGSAIFILLVGRAVAAISSRRTMFIL